MAKFADPLPTQKPVDPTRVLRGLSGTTKTADTSGSQLLGAASSLFTAGVSIADNEIREQIIDREEILADEFREADPLADQLTPVTVTPDSEDDFEHLDAANGGPVPKAIESSFQRLDRQRTGVAQGKVNENFFLEKLDAELKSLRHRFPGHRDFIDNEAARQTGLPSANARRNQRLANNAALATSFDKAQVAHEEARVAYLEAGGPVANVNRLNTQQLNESAALLRERKAARAEYRTERAQIPLERGERATKAVTLLSRMHNSRRTEALITKEGGIGVLVADVNSIFENAGGPGQKTPEFIAETRDKLNTFLEVMKTGIIADLHRRGEEAGATTLMEDIRAAPGREKTTDEEVVNMLTASEQGLIKGFLDKDVGIMVANANALKQSVADRGTDLVQKSPNLIRLRVMVNSLGPKAEELLGMGVGKTAIHNLNIASDVREGLDRQDRDIAVKEQERANHIAMEISNRVQTGNRRPGSTTPVVTKTQAARFIKSAGGKQAQAAAHKLNHEVMMATMLGGRDRATRLKAAQYFYNGAEKNYLMDVKDDQQAIMYSSFYNQTTAKAVKDIGDENLTLHFLNNAKNDLGALSVIGKSQLASFQNPLVTVSVGEDGFLKTTRKPADISGLSFDEGDESSALIIEDQVEKFNAMARQYKSITDIFGDGGDSLSTFYKDVAGITNMASAGATPDSPHVKLVQEAVKNTPALAAPSTAVSGDTFETDDSVANSRSFKELMESGLTETLKKAPAKLSEPQINRLVKEIASGNTFEDDDSVTNSRSFERLLQVAAPKLSPAKVKKVVGEIFSGDTFETDDSVTNSQRFERLIQGIREEEPAAIPPAPSTAVSGDTFETDDSVTNSRRFNRLTEGIDEAPPPVTPATAVSGDTFETDDSVTNSRIFNSLVEGIEEGEPIRPPATAVSGDTFERDDSLENNRPFVRLQEGVKADLGDEGVKLVVREVFSGDTFETDDSLINSRIFERLLNGEGIEDGVFPKVGNQGSGTGLRKFLDDLETTAADPSTNLPPKVKESLTDWIEDIRGSQEISKRAPSAITGEKFKDADDKIPEDIPVPFANPRRAFITAEEQQEEKAAIATLNAEPDVPLPDRKPSKERNIPVKDIESDELTPLLTFISKGEGGYDSSNNGTSRGRIVASTHNTARILGKSLVKFTIGEIMKMQKGTRRQGRKLFAVGRYQIIPKTMAQALRDSGLKKGDLFNEENQDKLGLALIMGSKRPKLAAYIRGAHNNLRTAMLEFAREWASLPHPDTGASVYGSGNRASHSRKSVAVALKAARKAWLTANAEDTEASAGPTV